MPYLIRRPQGEGDANPADPGIEIFSPEDRLSRVLHRLNAFLAMGIPHVWLLDPIERTAFTYTYAGLKLVEATRIPIENSPIYLDLPDVLSALD